MPVSHAQVFGSMRGAGIGVNLHYIPIYRQPYYARMGFAEGHCPEAERYYREAISIPIYPDLERSRAGSGGRLPAGRPGTMSPT